MPIESSYTDVVRTKMAGVITFKELIKHVEFLCGLEVESTTWIEFTDQTDTKSIDISSSQAKSIVNLAKPIHDRYSSIHNILLTSNLATFGIDRMIATHISIQSDKPVWHFVKSRDQAERLITIFLKADASPDCRCASRPA